MPPSDPVTGGGRVGGIESQVDIVFPVLDEAAALPWVLGRIPDGYHPIVVDNGSTDGSGSIAAELGAEVVSAPQRGFGAACWAGLQAATGHIVCFADADASLDPLDLPGLVELVRGGEAGLALGARQPEPGSWPIHARMANRVLAREMNRRAGLHLTDLGPLRAAERTGLLDLGLEDRRFGWPLEMVLRAAAAGWTITEVPVRYRPRTGRSKVTGTVAGTARAVRDMRRILRDVAPS
jgi:dTDP-L-rhamnose 4-epimerase